MRRWRSRLDLSTGFGQFFVKKVWEITRGAFPKNSMTHIPSVTLASLKSKKYFGLYHLIGKKIVIYMPTILRDMSKSDIAINKGNVKAVFGSILVHEFAHHIYWHEGVYDDHHKLMLNNKKLWRAIENVSDCCGDISVAMKILFRERLSMSQRDL